MVAATPPTGIAAAQEGLARAEALMTQARADGDRFLQTKDQKAKEAVGKTLKEAEKLLATLVKAHPGCERCEEERVGAFYLRGLIGLSKDFDDSLDEANKALRKFPLNGRLALYQGLSHYYSGDFGAAARSLKRYMASPARTPARDQVAGPALKDAQQRFLTTWYKQADFYQSPESRVTRLNPQTFRQEVTFQVTPEWELTTANQLAPVLAQQAPPVHDAELLAYLDRIVARLTTGTPGPNFQYRLTVLNSPAVNAVTVPGQIFVYTGLLHFVESESELAGVLSHELAHNYGHHAARTVIKQAAVAGLAGALVAAANPQTHTAQLVASVVAQLGVGLFQRAYSRFEEREADLYGAHILYNAGYNPTAMSGFNLRMYERNPRQPVTLLATHPPAPDRVEYLTDYLDAFDLSQPLTTDSEAFARIKVKFPSAPRGSVGAAWR